MYTYKYLENFTVDVLKKMGVNDRNALAATKVFLAAEIRGISSHGMIRIKDYFELMKLGRINVDPDIKIVHETMSTAVVDGDRGMGMLPAVKSMEIAIEKAKVAGTGWVSTRNSFHFGIACYYSRMALEHDMIGITMTNANPMVAPPFGVSRLLGTNPLAVAIPANKYPAFVADFSTSSIARGKLVVAEKQGKKVDFGFVQDKDGNASDDPAIMKKGGSMLPLGGDLLHGSHKGYCMSSIVDIFSAVLSGANFGPFVPPSVPFLPVLDEKVGEGTGHFFGAMRIDAFQKADEFKAKMDKWIETVKFSEKAKGHTEIFIPGEMEHKREKEIMENGIELLPAVIEDLKQIGGELGVDFE